MVRSRAWGRTAVVVVVVASGASLLGACSSGGSGGGAAAGDWCEVARTVFLLPADPDAPAAPKVDRDESVEMLKTVRAHAEGPAARRLDQLIELSKLDESEYDAHREQIDEAVATADELISWANRECPPDKPAWACLSPSTFTPIDRISVSGETTLPPEVDPEPAEPSAEALGSLLGPGPEGGTERVELDSSKGGGERTYAWLDDEGLVQETMTIRSVAGEWTKGPSSTCRPPGS